MSKNWQLKQGCQMTKSAIYRYFNNTMAALTYDLAALAG